MVRRVRWNNLEEWHLEPSSNRTRRDSSKSGRQDDFPEDFKSNKVAVVEELEATPRSARRTGEVPLVDISVPVERGASYVLALRHMSGALSFHTGEVEFKGTGRRSTSTAEAVRFRVELRAATGSRRGLFSKTVRVFILRVTGAIADPLLP